MLIECVPNFSEGRRRDVMEAIIDAITSVPVYLLDWSADPDHHRMVVTFAGDANEVEEAMFRGAETAARLIDLEAHQGEHPRIGATDVIPFIPLRDATMDDAVALAKRLGQRMAEALHIPVYLYEAAATRPERRNLASIRRGGYEALKAEITQPERVPDYGDPVIGKAGATAVGARPPLIAFNVYLDTERVEIAREIARAVRESSGGLAYVKALGLMVKGRAQVSINVIDFRKTSLHTLMHTLRSHAAAHHVRILESELIGLIPQAALIDYALADLQLSPAVQDRILEVRLGAATNDYREVIFE